MNQFDDIPIPDHIWACEFYLSLASFAESKGRLDIVERCTKQYERHNAAVQSVFSSMRVVADSETDSKAESS